MSIVPCTAQVKKTRRRSSQKENYEYEDADDFYYDHIDEYENYDDAQDDY